MHTTKLHNVCLLLAILTCASCVGQNQTLPDRKVGGPFENSEYMFIGMPDKITSVDTSPGWHQAGTKLLIQGKVLESDGITAAADKIIYYYHTDTKGMYTTSPELDPKMTRHGYIRGWVKSDPNGFYSIYTVRPGPYPDASEPAHIHVTIKETGLVPYWIDSFVFDDDPLAGSLYRQAQGNRGGNGVLQLAMNDELATAEHDIILGLNIPGYDP